MDQTIYIFSMDGNDMYVNEDSQSCTQEYDEDGKLELDLYCYSDESILFNKD